MSLQNVETNRIAALLDVAATEVAYLAECEGTRLAALRKAIAVSAIDRHRHLFERMARASSLLPAAIAGRIAQEIMGAEMIANLTPFMPPERAAEVSVRMSVAFQADVAVHMIPESSADLMAALDEDIRAAVTRELLARGEYAVMGTLVDYLPVDVIGKLSREITDPHALLLITSYVENKARLRAVIPGFDDVTILRMLQIASEHDLMPVLVEQAEALDASQRERIERLRGKASAAVAAAWAEACETLAGRGVHAAA